MPAVIRQLTRKEFPALLKEIPDCPPQLFIRGEMPPSGFVYLCVVGSRATTPYGRRTCASPLSGLARWGALVSERKSPWKAHPHDFAARNRIMAGMSKVILIIEAGEKSGTLITARLALDYNREVLCVPHELGRESGKGANQLIREGATLVCNSADVAEALGFKEKPEQETLPTDLTPQEEKILQALTGSAHKDDLLLATKLSAQEANIALSSLLIRGLIVERLGKVERV